MTQLNRTELVAAIAAESGQSQSAVNEVLDALFSTLAKSVAAGDKVTIPGWLAVEQNARAARPSRRARTGEPIKIAAARGVKIGVGSAPAKVEASAARELAKVLVGKGATQEEAVNDLTSAIRVRLIELANRGEQLANLGDVDDVAEQVVERLPIAVSPWVHVVGPCYTSRSLQKELNIGRAAISKAVSDLRLLRLETSDGRNVYPAFQVVDRTMVRGMRDVLNVLRQGIEDEWTWAQWLNTPVPDYAADEVASDAPKRRHIDRLIAGDIDGVVRAAERTAASWAA